MMKNTTVNSISKTHNMKRKLFSLNRIILGFCLLLGINAMAALKTPVASGNWNTPATWNGGTVPLNTDDV